MPMRIASLLGLLRFAGVLSTTLTALSALAVRCPAEYFAAGSVRYTVCDDGLGSEDYVNEIPGSEGRTMVSLAAGYTYEVGNNAYARTYANLASGALRTYAWAQYVEPNAYWHTRGESRAQVRDTLTFVVAPGHYADGAVVTVSGRLSGWLEGIGSYPGTHGKVNCQASFLGKEFEFVSDLNLVVNEYFQLGAPLINPGSTIENPLEIQAVIYASLYSEAQVKPSEVSTALSDFGGTFQFSELKVPDGVTWTSESGLFLTVPEPSTLVLLSMGGVILPWFIWRWRR